MSTKYAGVYLLDAPFSLDREYDYLIPEGINITPGDFVGLPFGNGNRRRIALVTSIKDTTDVPEGKVKPILAITMHRICIQRLKRLLIMQTLQV